MVGSTSIAHVYLLNRLLKTIKYTSSQCCGFHPIYECNLCNLYVCVSIFLSLLICSCFLNEMYRNISTKWLLFFSYKYQVVYLSNLHISTISTTIYDLADTSYNVSSNQLVSTMLVTQILFVSTINNRFFFYQPISVTKCIN